MVWRVVGICNYGGCLLLPVCECRTNCRKQSRWRGFYFGSTAIRGKVETLDGGARKESQPNENKAVEPPKDARNRKYVITAYCPCQKCCGKTDGITASGEKAVQGVTIATDKSMPFGTKVYIDGVGERIVQDRGGAIKGNRIDLYFDSHNEALNFGRQTKYVTILN